MDNWLNDLYTTWYHQDSSPALRGGGGACVSALRGGREMHVSHTCSYDFSHMQEVGHVAVPLPFYQLHKSADVIHGLWSPENIPPSPPSLTLPLGPPSLLWDGITHHIRGTVLDEAPPPPQGPACMLVMSVVHNSRHEHYPV